MNEEKKSLFEELLRRVAGARVFILLTFHAVVFSACYIFAWLVRCGDPTADVRTVTLRPSADFPWGS